MSTTVVGLFRETDQAQAAYNALREASFADTEAFVKGANNEAAFERELRDSGVTQDYVTLYTRGLENNGIVLLTHTSDNRSHEAELIMERHYSLDIDHEDLRIGHPDGAAVLTGTAGAASRTDYLGATPSGVTGYNTATTEANTSTGTAPPNPVPAVLREPRIVDVPAVPGKPSALDFENTVLQDGETRTLPEIQEELVVGKREVERGGVRVYTRVTERPVEAQVRLRDEKVVIQRREVNRPVEAGDLERFRDQEFELTETAEEAVVAKRAEVVGEVVVGKRVEQHTETVSDTVRRTEVEVEEITDTGFRTPLAAKP